MHFIVMISNPALVVLIILSLCGAMTACSGAPEPPPSVPGAPIGGTAAAGYVGASACSPCHQAISASFARSGMGRSFSPAATLSGQSARQGPAPPRFGVTIEIPEQDLRYTMFEQDGRYFQQQFELDARGRQSNADTREIVYVLGSGNHSLSFVTMNEGRLYQMPVCWYPDAQRWDLCPGYEDHNQFFQREIDDTCLFCHNGRVERTGRFNNMFTEPLPAGINCERCHGPGSVHVARWSSPSTADQEYIATDEGKPDATIVNPRHLPPDLRLQVCMQCHLGDAGQTARVMTRRDNLDGYRPGLPLQEFLAMHRYRQNLPGRFGLGAQADRLSLSRCFQQSAGRLQCITCHDPHVEAYDLRESSPGHYDAACVTCHQIDDCAVPSTMRKESCITCHMRRAEPHDQRHTTFTDHWIRRQPEEGLAESRDDFVMEPFLPGGESSQSRPAEPAMEAERWLNLGRAYFYKKIDSVDARQMPWEYSVTALSTAARLSPRDARPHFFLGKVEMSKGRAAAAERHFRAAVNLDPGYVEALQELGSALLAVGAIDEAATTLKRVLTLGPPGDDEGAVHNELARIAMQRGRYDEARSHLRAALAVEPLGPEIHANLGLLASLEGNPAAAVPSLRKALSLSPGNAAILIYLAGALARTDGPGDHEEALMTARRAVEISPDNTLARQLLEEISRRATTSK